MPLTTYDNEEKVRLEDLHQVSQRGVIVINIEFSNMLPKFNQIPIETQPIKIPPGQNL